MKCSMENVDKLVGGYETEITKIDAIGCIKMVGTFISTN
jgi:hypothetical protein